MQKVIATLLILSLLVVFGCQKQTTDVPPPEDNTETTQEQPVETTDIAEIERSNVIVQSSSELQDDTGYGFAYAAANVLDLDYSTAWCPDVSQDKPQLSTITLNFPEPTELGKVGIVPGFARDEQIFQENNRIQTLEVWYDDQPEALDELSFEDEYEMQFFKMPNEPVQSLTFKITQTYAGSKYDDTCIAEIDFWSDWVEQQDAQAAENYYLKNKAEFAERPLAVTNIVAAHAYEYKGRSPADVVDSCGYAKAGEKYNIAGEHVVPTFELNSKPPASGQLSIKWIQTSSVFPLETPELVYARNVEAKECGGKVFVTDLAGGEYATFGGFTVQLLFNNRVIGQTKYTLAQ